MLFEQSVVIYFDYGLEDNEPFYSLSEKLDKVISEQNLGSYDGHEIALDHSEGSYYIYGPSAENIFKAIKPLLDQTPFLKGGTAILRFGRLDEECPELELDL